ncbi:hypothetical protein C2G38_2241570 [Gigaspora rosea]|uniref:Uncharacterized protein n=1 Tax=Gigaspora rosea TaxID=44941 RepID=A0A397W1F5_9GLOM|nr:hypothetical protein C2G38_2241570 [Gigaspora rosea]
MKIIRLSTTLLRSRYSLLQFFAFPTCPNQVNIEKSPEGIVILDYNDILTNVDVSDAIEEAFGTHSHCLGIILIKTYLKFMLKKRTRLLRLASVFAMLPEDIKNNTMIKQLEIVMRLKILGVMASPITGLTSAMYLNESDSTFPKVQCPDPSSGLYIKTKSKKTVKVSIPKDYLAFQLGEAMQLVSGNTVIY